VVGCCGHENEPSGSIEGGEFIEKLSYYHLLQKNSVPCIDRTLNNGQRSIRQFRKFVHCQRVV